MNVPEVDSRIACGTSLMSYSPLPSSSVNPTVAPFIRVSLNFSEITIWPLYVVLSGLPAEIGMVLISLPSRTTFIVLDLASTVLTCEWPTLNVTVFSWTPFTPDDASTPSRSSFRVTVELAFQYSFGRRSRRLPLNQWPTTSWPLSEVTLMWDWTSFLLSTALSKLIDTGMPTPTVEPSSGVKLPM